MERIDNDDEAYLAMLREPLFLDSKHKEHFDAKLERFFDEIFSLPLQRARKRSRNSLSALEEGQYGRYVWFIETIKKSFLGFCAVSLGNSKGVLGYNPPKLVKFIKSLWSRV